MEEEKSKVKKIERIKEENPNALFYYIGDTSGDIKEGQKAGVTTVAVTWGFHEKENLEKENPDHIVDTPIELVKLFKSMDKS